MCWTDGISGHSAGEKRYFDTAGQIEYPDIAGQIGYLGNFLDVQDI